MKVIYSFNKKGFEADYWTREIAAASTPECEFIPFNHDPYLNPSLYIRAQLLDNLYYSKHLGLIRMYRDFEGAIKEYRAEAVIVDNCPPYHPDYLRRLNVYKVLRVADGPMSAYDRDFAYLHAYDHILYHSPAYSAEMGMAEKLRYCGAKNADFLPLGLFDVAFDASKTEETILAGERDIDIIFIGALHVGKMPILARLRKAFGRRFRIHGIAGTKRNVYFNLKYGFPGWIRPVDFKEYVSLYQRARIGVNVHNRGDFTVGSFRLFELPGNGVMQISDGGKYLDAFFKMGQEVVGYRDVDDLIDKLYYYLEHDMERRQVALNGHLRVKQDYRFRAIMCRAGEMIREGMEKSK